MLRLPTVIESLSIVGDEAARRSIRTLALRPRTISTGSERDGLAVRAAGYPHASLFFFDENVWVEPGGFWLQGQSAARVMAQPTDCAVPCEVPLLLRGGAVPNRVILSAGRWRQVVSLAPGEERTLTLPAAAQAPAVLDIRSESGFRPAQVDPASTDLRLLGAWVAPR